MGQIEEHRAVQNAAKEVLERLSATLTPTDSERSIASRAVEFLWEHGITETWYHSCPALVLAGSRTCLSESGSDYRAASDEIGRLNLVTVDLSPSLGGVWGDCARSFFIEDGIAVREPLTTDFAQGRELLRQLHRHLRSYATAETSFGEVCDKLTAKIHEAGFVNLDFLGNIGHTIESEPTKRIFIEHGNGRSLGSAQLFTFEPHIKAVGGTWGFKHEDIYYFQDGKLNLL